MGGGTCQFLMSAVVYSSTKHPVSLSNECYAIHWTGAKVLFAFDGARFICCLSAVKTKDACADSLAYWT